MKNINVYILGRLNDTMTGDELERTLDAYREAENQLACFGFGVLSPHHLPADLRGNRGASIILSMIQAANICYVMDYAPDILRTKDSALAEAFGKTVYLPDSLYSPGGFLRAAMDVEKIDKAKEG